MSRTAWTGVVVVGSEGHAREAARRIVGAVRDAVEEKGRCCAALSGGSTPEPVYRVMASGEAGELPWERLSFYFADERCVPPEDEASNYRMVVDSLLAGHQEHRSRVHRMQGEAEPQRAAELYQRELPDPLDLVLLGIGQDGHTASLFPGGEAVGEDSRRVVAVRDAPKPPAARLTVTPPVLRDARRLVVLARGRAKADAVAAALAEEGSVHEIPARLARRGLWILDEEAASAIEGSP